MNLATRQEHKEGQEPRSDNSPNPNAKPALPVEREGLLKRLRGRLRSLLFFSSGDELKTAIAEALEESPATATDLPSEEKTILRNLLVFTEKPVRDIMISRSQIQAIDYGVTLDELKKLVGDKSHTRLPVYKDSLDNVKGLIHVKDLFPVINGDAVFDMATLLRDALFVPPSMKMLDLLVKMRLSRVHMAIVVDEYGGTDGLVTMEDLFEQIVGEIHDEHDEGYAHDGLHWSPQHTVELDAKTSVDRLERDLSLNLREENEETHYDTLGGLIFFLCGRVPAKGEKIPYKKHIIFEILDGDARRIKRVRIVNKASPSIGGVGK